jgi:hypothetical protein
MVINLCFIAPVFDFSIKANLKFSLAWHFFILSHLVRAAAQ